MNEFRFMVGTVGLDGTPGKFMRQVGKILQRIKPLCVNYYICFLPVQDVQKLRLHTSPQQCTIHRPSPEAHDSRTTSNFTPTNHHPLKTFITQAFCKNLIMKSIGLFYFEFSPILYVLWTSPEQLKHSVPLTSFRHL